jgi:hypothetical protein
MMRVIRWKKRQYEDSTINNIVQSSSSLTPQETENCAKIDNKVYKIADDAGRTERLASFVSQLEFEHSIDPRADSYSKLYSLINISYPIFVHYEELSNNLKLRYDWVIDKVYYIPDELYEQLPCQKRNAMNIVFEKVLGKIK